MTIFAKAAVVALGVGGIVVTGCYIGGVFGGETEYYLLSEGNNETSEYTNKVGDKYKMYLVSPTNQANEAWWKETYEKYKNDFDGAAGSSGALSTHFAKNNSTTKVTSAYASATDTATTTSLNKVCEEAYKKDPINDVGFYSTNHSEEKYKLSIDILKYCSPLGEIPSIISNSNDEGKIRKQGNTKKLVVATNGDNAKFWELQNKWFKKLGSKNASELGDYFTPKKDQNIKDICKEAYDRTAATGNSTANEPTIEDVVKYCAFEKTTA